MKKLLGKVVIGLALCGVLLFGVSCDKSSTNGSNVEIDEALPHYLPK